MDELFEKRKKIIYEFICDEFYVPMKLKELSMLLQVPKDQKGELKAVMDSLEKEGRVHVTQKGKYIKGEAKQLRGMFQANARGFGFVTVEGESEDIFISEDDMNGAMQGDEVEVVITKAPEGKRREGKITKIVQRGTQRIVGYYQSRKNFGFVVPDNERFLQDIFVPAERSKGAVTGHKVVVELTSYGENGKKPEGKIVEQKPDSPTLTYNTIGRHISKMVYTKVVTDKSPWLAQAELGKVYCNPASHGEGRFVAPKEWLDKLFANGQVATQYVNEAGVPTMDEEWNVNGSYCSIEGITSPDGRVLGKMAHSERRDRSVAMNIYGEQDLKIFESGVKYFK